MAKINGIMDDRIRLKSTQPADLRAYLEGICGSDFEGCLCTRPKGHGGLHRCGDTGNKCEQWTDQQAIAWWEEFKRNL